MGIIQHEAVIAVLNDRDAAAEMLAWIAQLPIENQQLFIDAPCVMNGYHTFVMIPDGSKEGWPDSDYYDTLRQRFIDRLDCQWAKVSFGELGLSVEDDNT